MPLGSPEPNASECTPNVGDDLRRVGRESDPRGVASIAVLGGVTVVCILSHV